MLFCTLYFEATAELPPFDGGEFGIGQDQLVSLTRDHDTPTLQQYGGASQAYK